MTAGGAAVFAAGAVVVLGTLASAVRTMVVPRALHSFLARTVFEAVRGVLRLLLGRNPSFHRRDRVMAQFAPVSMFVLPGVWLAAVHSGYTGMYWGLGSRSLRTAFAISGSSLFTLGSRTASDLPTQLLTYTEAGVGVGLLALLITYLPALYATFNRRELAVALLEVRADSPPSGPNMIVRYHRIGWDGGLTQVWKDWEVWFADLEETHTSLPALAFFRSPEPDKSWVTAAGAVLDGAALRASTINASPDPEASLCIRAGYVALRRLADFYGIPYDPDPSPGDPVSVTREEYDEVCARLEREGLTLKEDRDQAWLDFAGWRVNYDAALVGLAALTMAPEAPWSSDRGAPFRRPPVFGRRRRPGQEGGEGTGTKGPELRR